MGRLYLATRLRTGSLFNPDAVQYIGLKITSVPLVAGAASG